MNFFTIRISFSRLFSSLPLRLFLKFLPFVEGNNPHRGRVCSSQTDGWTCAQFEWKHLAMPISVGAIAVG